MNGAALIVITAATLVVLAAAAVVATVYVRRRRSFLARARTVPAVVTGIRQTVFSAGRPSYFARVSFTAETGMPVTTEVRLYNIGVAPRLGPGLPPVRPGVRLWVDYDPAAPATAEINTQAIPAASRPPGRPNTIIVVGLFCGVVMAVLVVGGILVIVGTQ
ncbi:MAG TPA: DUF3592 domain-containing protein [Streptosporangiaceae bacterium]|jgi:hypothetical protein